jgi:DNA-binding XRE family transcriptional regulator
MKCPNTFYTIPYRICQDTGPITAAQVGVTRQTINSIEKGRFNPNLRLAFKITRAFGKQIAEVSLA